MNRMFSSRVVSLAVLVFLVGAAGLRAQSSDTKETQYTRLYGYATYNQGITDTMFFGHDLFSGTIGTNSGALFRMPFLPFLYVGPQIGWRRPSIQGDTGLHMDMLYAGVTAQASWDVFNWLNLSGGLDAGYFAAWLTGSGLDSTQSGFNPRFALTGSLSWYFTPTIGVALTGGVEAYMGAVASWQVSLGPRFRLLGLSQQAGKTTTVIKPKETPQPAPPTTKPTPTPLKTTAQPAARETQPETVAVTKTDLLPIFPIFYKYFDDHPLGTITIKNTSSEPVEIRSVDFLIKQYMDNPKTCASNLRLGPGETSQVDLFALFTNRVLEISEGTKVSANLKITYVRGGTSKVLDHVETVRIYDRNALTWDDNRRAAAFVAAKDSSVLKFSKNVLGMVSDVGSRAVNKNLRTAMAIHDALGLYGMAYVIDPSTPYAELSKNKVAVDYLQFPSQTLEFKAGDCDDLSILYTSLLESVGIETAFITVPGHIFIAFSIDSPPDRARKDFLHPDDFIFTNGKSWIPVEITSIKESFLDAWQLGAKEWRENSARQQAEFYPIHDAWQVFEPVGFSGSSAGVAVPARDAVVSRYLQEVVRFIDNEIYPQVARIQGKVQSNPGEVRYINQLGVLYARYGLDDRAQQQFQQILSKRPYMPALINMGNLAFLEKNMAKALEFYTRAQELSPNNPNVLLAVARVNHELENYGTAKLAYEKLKSVRPDLATQFAYLDLRGSEAARAAEISQTKELVLWDEEP